MTDPQNQLFLRRDIKTDRAPHLDNIRRIEDWTNAPKDLAQMTGALAATGGTISGDLDVGGILSIPSSTATPRIDLGAQTVGSVAYILLVWDGSQIYFGVKSDGSVVANTLAWGDGTARLNADNTLTLPEVAGVQTPAHVQSTKNNGTGVSTLSKAWTSSTASGNFLVVGFSWPSSTITVSTAPTGYTQLGTTQANATAGNTLSTAFYYKANCGAAEAAPSITLSASTDICMVQGEYSNIATSSPLDKNATALSGGQVAADSGSTASTTQAYELWSAILATPKGASFTGTPGNAFTSRQAATQGVMALSLYDKIVTAVGVAHATQSYTTNSSYNGHIGTFKAKSTSVNTPAANTIVEYAKDNAGVSRAYYKDDGGTEHGPL
jgi:hypothetical protein